MLRNDLALNGAKFGCRLAQCGACVVLIDGRAARSCVTMIETVGDSLITTIEGLGAIDKPLPLQRAFMEEQAAQCSYCFYAMIMMAKEILERSATRNPPNATRGMGRQRTCAAAAPMAASFVRSSGRQI